MKSIFSTSILLLAFLFMSCSQNAQTTQTQSNQSKKIDNQVITVLQPVDFERQTTSKKVQLVDIRTLGEFNQGHLKDALNYDFYKPTFMQQMNTLDKSQPVYIYCRSGHRSGIAAKKLERAGFKKVYDLRGGVNYWMRNGLKLTR